MNLDHVLIPKQFPIVATEITEKNIEETYSWLDKIGIVTDKKTDGPLENWYIKYKQVHKCTANVAVTQMKIGDFVIVESSEGAIINIYSMPRDNLEKIYEIAPLSKRNQQ